MTTCKDSLELLQAYVDGELSPGERARLETHFGDCTPCEAFLLTYRETPRLAREALKAEMPAEMGARLTSFLRNAMGPCCCATKKKQG